VVADVYSYVQSMRKTGRQRICSLSPMRKPSRAFFSGDIQVPAGDCPFRHRDRLVCHCLFGHSQRKICRNIIQTRSGNRSRPGVPTIHHEKVESAMDGTISITCSNKGDRGRKRPIHRNLLCRSQKLGRSHSAEALWMRPSLWIGKRPVASRQADPWEV